MYSGVTVMYRTMAETELVGAVMRLIAELKSRVPKRMSVTPHHFSVMAYYLHRKREVNAVDCMRDVNLPMRSIEIGERMELSIQSCLRTGSVELWLARIEAVRRVQVELEERVGKEILRRYEMSGAQVRIGEHEIVNCEDDGWPRLIARANFAFELSGGGDIPYGTHKEVVYAAIVKSKAFGDLRSIVEGVVGPVEVGRY